MAQVVGLDVGTRTICGVVFSGAAKKFRLTDFFVETVPSVEGAAEESGAGEVVAARGVPDVIAKLLQDRGLEHADVVAAVDSKDCIIREIPIPFTREEHIRKVILTEAENHFQTFDIEEVILEWLKLEEVGEKSRVLIAALRKAAIRERLEVLKSAGVDPVALDLDAAALFNAFTLTATFDPDRNVLLIDMGGTSTKVLLVERGRLKKLRSIRTESFVASPARLPARAAEPVAAGVHALPAPESYSIEARFLEIENALRRLEPEGGMLTGADEPIAILSDEEFDKVRQPPRAAAGTAEGGGGASTATGTVPTGTVAGNGPEGSGENAGTATSGSFAAPPRLDYAGYLERLSLEIQRTFANLSTGRGVDLICLTGGLSRGEEARRFFTDQFDVETIQLDFGDSFPMDIHEEAREELSRVGAVAVGLAVKELGHDRVGFDFRKREFRFERKFERVKYPVLCAAALTCLVFLLWTFNLCNAHLFYTRNRTTVRGMEQQKFTEFFGHDASSNLLLPQAEIEKKKWQSLLGVEGGNIPYFVPVVDALEEIGRALQECRTPHRLDTVDLKLRTKSVKGRIAAEASSSVSVTCSQQGLGTQLQKLFGRTGGIFSAEASENASGTGASRSYKVTLKLTPQDRYLNDPKR